MVRRERVVVRRGPRTRGSSWLPALLVIGLLVIGGIVAWMLLSGDDSGTVDGAFMLGGLGTTTMVGRLRRGAGLPDPA